MPTLGSGKSKLGIGMLTLNEMLGSDGNESAGSPGSDSAGKLQLMGYSQTTFNEALAEIPVGPVQTLLTPGTAMEPRTTDEPSI